MLGQDIVARIEAAWDNRAEIGFSTQGEVRDSVEKTLAALDAGEIRVAEKKDGAWTVNQWIKKAVLLSFRLNDNQIVGHGPGDAVWWDKVPSKFAGWGEEQFRKAGFRAVPGSIVRRGAHIAPNVVLMPSFVNLGASTKIVDRATGEVFIGRVPAYSVVVSGSMPGKPLPDGTPGPSLYCAVIVKRVDAQTRAKTAINELLRA